VRQHSRRRPTLKGGSYLDQNGVEDVRLRLAAILDSSNDAVIPKSLDRGISICTIRRSSSRSVRVDDRIEHQRKAPLDADGFTAKRWNAGCQQTVNEIAGQDVSFP